MSFAVLDFAVLVLNVFSISCTHHPISSCHNYSARKKKSLYVRIQFYSYKIRLPICYSLKEMKQNWKIDIFKNATATQTQSAKLCI